MAKRQIYIRRKISMYGRSSSIKLDVASSTGFINHFSNIRCLDAIDEQSVFKVFHVEPEKLQLETLNFKKRRTFALIRMVHFVPAWIPHLPIQYRVKKLRKR